MPLEAVAQAGKKLDNFVLSLLPPYCKGRYVENYPKRDYWKRYLEENELRGPHHACAGVVLLIEAQREQDRKKKNYLLHQAIGEIQYTLRGAEKYNSKDRKVRADLYFRVGSAISQMTDPFTMKQHNAPDSGI